MARLRGSTVLSGGKTFYSLAPSPTHPPSGRPSIRVLGNLSGHISSIRAIAACRMDEGRPDRQLMVSAGGRAQMMLWCLDLHAPDGVVGQELACHFLWTADGPRRKPWRDGLSAEDALARYLGVAVWRTEKDKNSFGIAAAGSDAFVRFFGYAWSENKLQLQRSIQTGHHCLLTAAYLQPPFMGENADQASWQAFQGVLVFSATDGTLNFWEVPSMAVTDEDFPASSGNVILEAMEDDQESTANLAMSVMAVLHQHQSGINAVEFCWIPGDQLLTCTGGDDGYLVAALLRFSQCKLRDKLSIDMVTSCTVPGAHASQITGVDFLRSDLVVSASVDQRVRMWRCCRSRTSDKLSLTLLATVVSAVPDIACLTCWPTRLPDTWDVLLCGEGTEVVRLRAVRT